MDVCGLFQLFRATGVSSFDATSQRNKGISGGTNPRLDGATINAFGKLLVSENEDIKKNEQEFTRLMQA